MIAIQTKKLTKQYKDKIAVDELDLEIKQGELVSLLGMNGAGKSTTIKMLSCLVEPTSGDAWLHGNSIISNKLKVKEIINVSPQETAVAPNLSVRENLELIAGLYGYQRAEAKQKAADTIQAFGFGSIASKRAATLSGGWQRRLSIAMALISNPRILFLDEPTLGLDILARRELWSMVEQLKGKMTIILTTHYLEEAAALSDRIGIIANGRLKAFGTVQELMQLTSTNSLEDAFLKVAAEGGLPS